jgi:hypothetical protein
VPSLSTGQSIFVPGQQFSPNPNNQFAQINANQSSFRPPNSLFNPAQTSQPNSPLQPPAPTSVPNFSPFQQNPYSNVDTFGRGRGTNANFAPPPPAPISATSPAGVQANAAARTAALSQASLAVASNPVPTQITLPDNYVYTGGNSPEAQQQRYLWNVAAGGDPNIAPADQPRVFLMSRAQRHAIGDARRRRRGRSAQQEASHQAALDAVTTAEVPAPQGNAVNSSLRWNAG